MTREEAKTRLIAMKAKFEILLSMRGLEMSDVFDVAIETLSADPCEDAVSRQAVKDVICEYICLCDENYGQIMECIDKLPPVTPKQTDVLDKIRAEIMLKDGLEEALEIIDKYKAESEEE